MNKLVSGLLILVLLVGLSALTLAQDDMSGGLSFDFYRRADRGVALFAECAFSPGRRI